MASASDAGGEILEYSVQLPGVWTERVRAPACTSARSILDLARERLEHNPVGWWEFDLGRFEVRRYGDVLLYEEGAQRGEMRNVADADRGAADEASDDRDAHLPTNVEADWAVELDGRTVWLALRKGEMLSTQRHHGSDDAVLISRRPAQRRSGVHVPVTARLRFEGRELDEDAMPSTLGAGIGESAFLAIQGGVDLSGVGQLLMETRDVVLALDPQDLVEVSEWASPPVAVLPLMALLVCMLDNSPVDAEAEAASWKRAKILLGDSDFMARVRAVTPEGLRDDCRRSARSFIDTCLASADSAEKRNAFSRDSGTLDQWSPAVAAMLPWLLAVVMYAEVLAGEREDGDLGLGDTLGDEN
eukprot:TRINITY_DN30847_c0_g2_i1.p1 TRINITY_DN30847_c0_g2~~TRINITY_DN30847_c0_g2_i1.p1  ORF type:complete len:370 (+),score=58.62 TRINITY_DN30847_c0_g2_i1:35-1111(+)